MRIQHPQSNASQPSLKQSEAATKAQAAEAKKAQGKPAPQAKGGEGSTIAEISAKAKELAQAKSAAANAPEVREGRVAELRNKIQNKEYNVDPEAIAERMLREHSEL